MIACKDGTEHYILALTIWREARGEKAEAQHGVAFTVLNRVARPGWWGRTIDDVCTKRWQYSSLTDPKDPQLTKWPLVSDPSWRASWIAAGEVLDGVVTNLVPGADSYYDDSIAASPPVWSKTARFVGKMGRLNFFDVDRDHEMPMVVKAVPPPPPGSDDFDARLRAFLSGKAA
jgi:cell wall hydrolase